MSVKTTTPGFRFLTRIPKLLAPFLLFAVVGFLHNAVKLVYVHPLSAEMSRHLHEMEEHMDRSSAEYARLLQETQQDAMKILLISIAIALVTLTLAFAKQITAHFSFTASSTTYSGSGGDRYSLVELLREATRWHNLKSALITTAAVITLLQLASMALSGANFATVMRNFEVLSVSVQGLIFLLAFLYLGVIALVNVAGSVKRNECYVLVLVTLLLPTLLIPLCAVALLYLYPEVIMALGLRLLSVDDLLQGVQNLLYLAAACVYSQWSSDINVS